MPEDITATPPDATETFLDNDWHQTSTSTVHVFQESAGPYKKIELHNFTFLGRTFQPQSYSGTKNGAPVAETRHTGAGVCAEFRDILFRAQRLIFRSYAAQERSQGREPTPAGFTEWCGVQVVSGWQFRSRQHSKGLAIDLDPKFNPYVPTGKKRIRSTYGGEHHGLDGATETEIRTAALDAYQNAFLLVHGIPMPDDAMGHSASDDTSQIHHDISRVHYALVVYFQLAFLRTSDNQLKQEFGHSRPFGPKSEPGSFLFTLDQFRPLIKGTPDANSRKLYDTIRDDYEKLRLGMVYGKLVAADPGHMNLKATWAQSTRDPCYGILSIRKEIAMGLRAAGCRWGAIDFGSSFNGDMMHFDKRLSIDQINHTDDPNPEGLLYVRA